MTQYEIVAKVLNDELTIVAANKELMKLRSDIVLSKRNLPTISELERNSFATLTGVGFMNHGVGDNEKIYVKDGVLDQDTGFYVSEDEHAPKAFYTFVAKDGEGFFQIDGDKLVKL